MGLRKKKWSTTCLALLESEQHGHFLQSFLLWSYGLFCMLTHTKFQRHTFKAQRGFIFLKNGFFFKSFGTLGSCHFTKGYFFSCGKEGFVFFHLFSVLLLLVFIKKLDLGPFVKGLHLTWWGKKKRIIHSSGCSTDSHILRKYFFSGVLTFYWFFCCNFFQAFL